MTRDNHDAFIMNCLTSFFDGNTIKNNLLNVSAQELSKRITFYGVAGFFYHALKDGRMECDFTPQLLESLKPAAQSILLHNALYEREGKKLTDTLANLGISYVMLKGFSLMERLYGHTGVRPISDLDIYVSRDQYPQIKQYLLDTGFLCQMEADFRGTLEEYQKIGELYSTEMQFRKSMGQFNINLDIHWGIDGLWEGSPLKPLFPVESFPWLQGLQTAQAGTWHMTTLNQEMQFLHLVSHFALHHQYQGLKWFLDIGLFIDKIGEELDWDYIYKTAATDDIRKMIGITLRMIDDELGLYKPGVPSWQDYWSGNGLPGEYRFYRRRLLSEGSKNTQYLAYIMLPYHWRDKFKVTRYFLFSPDAVSHWRSGDTKIKPSIWQPVYLMYRAGEAALLKRRKKPS